MMTRKNYIAIAEVLDANRAPLALVQDMADLLEEDNPRFDRDRFIAASTKMLYNILNLDKSIIDKARK